MVPNLNKICRICLSLGSRSIFTDGNCSSPQNEPNDRGEIVKKSDTMSLDKIAAKLRFVTLMKVKENENLPSLICDLCIVQLNVAYNFKRLALENDFRLRQYLIENGISLEKENISEPQPTAQTTSLQIHQIDVIVDHPRSNRFREPELPGRRNSVVSTASTSTCFNNRDTTNTPNSTVQEVTNRFILPKPMIRPIQVKIEPVDHVEEDPENNTVPQTNSPSASSSSGSASHISIISHQPSTSVSLNSRSPPMIQIPLQQTVLEVQSSPESDKSKTTEVDLTEIITAESFSGNTPEIPPRKYPPSTYSTNANKDTESTTSNNKEVSVKRIPSPSVMTTRKSKTNKNTDEGPRKYRELRTVERKSLNEVKMRSQFKHVIIKEDEDKKGKRKKLTEGFLKSVSAAFRMKQKQKEQKQKKQEKLKQLKEKEKLKKKKLKEKLKLKIEGKRGRKPKDVIVVKRKYVRKNPANVPETASK